MRTLIRKYHAVCLSLWIWRQNIKRRIICWILGG